MLKIYTAIFCLLFFKLSAQTYFTPQLDKNSDVPLAEYELGIATYFNTNVENEYKRQEYYLTFDDFGLRKDKPVKELTIDTNTDGTIEYYYQFNQDGTIALFKNYVDNDNRSYEYFENLIVIKQEPLVKYKDGLFTTSIDSVFFDHNRRIVKELCSFVFHGTGGVDTFRKVVEYQFSKSNQLEKKYYYSVRKRPGYSKDFIDGKEIFYENYKDSIVEKGYYAKEQKTELKDRADEKKGLISKSVYYLNNSNIVERVKVFYSNSSSDVKYDFTINYDKLGRVANYQDRDKESCSFGYDKNDKINQIKRKNKKEPEVVINYIYDNNGRFIYSQKKGEEEKINPRHFTYEKFGNWETETWDTVIKGVKLTTLITRKISYY
ncbi:hypothetical protein [Flavobacterium sp. 2]|uniref:hypothetical protein n=1 Tax=Flavobacterium sp. 2 TaxID=308053 RepID=UPI003CE8C0A2